MDQHGGPQVCIGKIVCAGRLEETHWWVCAGEGGPDGCPAAVGCKSSHFASTMPMVTGQFGVGLPVSDSIINVVRIYNSIA